MRSCRLVNWAGVKFTLDAVRDKSGGCRELPLEMPERCSVCSPGSVRRRGVWSLEELLAPLCGWPLTGVEGSDAVWSPEDFSPEEERLAPLRGCGPHWRGGF